MIKKFIVENFKGFDKPVILDFTSSNYSFNQNLTFNGLASKVILYGKNGSGKSALGIALFDIVYHLTDKQNMKDYYTQNYRNLNKLNEPVKFTYIFKFGNDIVEYYYEKLSIDNLIKEKLIINKKIIIDYDFLDFNNRYIDDDLISNLNIELLDSKISIVKYISRSLPTTIIPKISKMINFCERMLWYRCLSSSNDYFGFTNGITSLSQKLYESGRLDDFVEFLKCNGVKYNLNFEFINGKYELFAYFDNGVKTTFSSIASTGTMALFLFYIWNITLFDKISFLFIDEFDAFLYFEVSKNLIKILNECNFQMIITTHNTNLLSNSITRPDCCYIISKNKISSLNKATTRELREGHNLEKLFKSGVFKCQK